MGGGPLSAVPPPSTVPVPPAPPEPPAPLETEPSLPPPDDSSVYIQGYWVYREPNWTWRPGFYAPYRLGRVWNGPRYIWTPAGYIFVDGYWDYCVDRRGVLFAPVYFEPGVYVRSGYYYSPFVVIDLAGK